MKNIERENKWNEMLELGDEFIRWYKKERRGVGEIKKVFFNKKIWWFVWYRDKHLDVCREDEGK